MPSGAPTVLLFGGNGFVGTHSAAQLVAAGANVICCSRSGVRPRHLRDASWADAVDWRKADALDATASDFSGVDALVALIASPPLPTFSNAAYERQCFMCSEPNRRSIAAAQQAGVQNLVVLGAAFPRLLQSQRFGYYVGKQRSLEAAKDFAAHSNAHRAIVLQPSNIYGTRHSKGGMPIPLAPLMAPLGIFFRNYFVSVHKVAACVRDAALGVDCPEPGLQLVSQQMLRQKQL